jgi:hypothetical protein
MAGSDRSSGDETGRSARKGRKSGARDRAAADLPARQENLLRLNDLMKMVGLSEDEIRTRVRRGQLYPVHRAVFAWGTPPLTDHALMRAALWACCDQAFLSHGTGAALYGQRQLDRDKIEVTVPHTRGRRRDGLILHRTADTIDRREIRTWSGLRVSTFPRLLVELARTSTPRELDDLLTFAARKRLFTPRELEAELLRHAGRPGMALLKAATARYRPTPNRKSTFEYSFDAALLKRPDIPPYEKNVYLGIWEIDCLWRRQKVAVELDFRDYHAAIQDFDKDRRKDTQVQLMGYKPMRISEFLWNYDREQTMLDLEAMLGLRPPVLLRRRR